MAIYEKMYYWQLWIAGVDATSMFKNFIHTLLVKYEIQKQTIATIGLSAPSFVEGILSENQEIEIWMGLYRHELVQMFKGNITKPPTGTATEILNYTIKAVDSIKGSRQTIIKNYEVSNKTAIVSEIIIRMGYIPIINISDNSPIQAIDNVIQYNKTDEQFIVELADRWACLVWKDSIKNVIYFVDDSKAFQYGNDIKNPNILDPESDYILAYRADNRKNNVESIQWGSNSAAGLSESVNENDIQVNNNPDFLGDVSAYGKEYSLKPEWREAVKKDSSLNAKILGMISGADRAKNEAVLNKYFYVRTTGADKDDRRRTRGVHNANGLNITVNLNEPDFYLRPPRTAKIIDGSLNQNMPTAHLPDFLFSEPKETTKFFINSVETGIRSGVGTSQIEVSR